MACRRSGCAACQQRPTACATARSFRLVVDFESPLPKGAVSPVACPARIPVRRPTSGAAGVVRSFVGLTGLFDLDASALVPMSDASRQCPGFMSECTPRSRQDFRVPVGLRRFPSGCLLVTANQALGDVMRGAYGVSASRPLITTNKRSPGLTPTGWLLLLTAVTNGTQDMQCAVRSRPLATGELFRGTCLGSYTSGVSSSSRSSAASSGGLH